MAMLCSTCGMRTCAHAENTFDPALDPGIAEVVRHLRAFGIETFESCQGGPGHAYPEPTVRFHGSRPEGFRALSIALLGGFRVAALRRTWLLQDDEPTGPYWELVFERSDGGQAAYSSAQCIRLD